MTDVVEAKYMCRFIHSELNMLPSVSAFLTYLRALSPKERTGLAFGSYGWGGQSIDQVDEGLKMCGFEMLEKIRCKYIPAPETLSEITSKIEKSV